MEAGPDTRQFWNQWSKEYVTLLHSRKKWHKTWKNLEVDDLVLIIDEQMKRCEWNLGCIIATDSEKDHVRKVDVLRADGRVTTKDRTKLVLLEIDEEADLVPTSQL